MTTDTTVPQFNAQVLSAAHRAVKLARKAGVLPLALAGRCTFNMAAQNAIMDVMDALNKQYGFVDRGEWETLDTMTRQALAAAAQ